MYKDIINILSTTTFQKLINNDCIKIEQLNAATTLLIKMNIPFSLSFSQATRESTKSIELTISINPNTVITFSIDFDE
ncbi:hypothetical protein [Anaerosalibacter sp. Marseille-P3206]|uniref:hypothetical protein n=1 Tax=Anaerosalibacter sp. Marseille-P3206 TaxID=1871005 RepID=UPI000987174C|nr:hypothetical protein [Anaerosalibacter sp. Marseille-P3206]